VWEDQSWPSILLEIRFSLSHLVKGEIDLVRVHCAQREGRFSEERRGGLLKDLERRVCTGNGGDFQQRDHLVFSSIAGPIPYRERVIQQATQRAHAGRSYRSCRGWQLGFSELVGFDLVKRGA